MRPIGELIEGCWPGEWGTDPVENVANCVVYRATDIDDDGHVNLEGGAERYVTPLKLSTKSLRTNDILLEASGGAPDKPVGRAALVERPSRSVALTSNFFRFIRPKQGVDPKFLTLQLVALNRSPSIWRYQQQTTGLVNLKVSDYLRHGIWCPKLGSQRKIASVLSRVESAIAETELLTAKYQQIKAGMMQDLFTRGAPDGARHLAPRATQLIRGIRLPSEWGIATLRSCLTENPANGIYKPAHAIGSEGTLMIGQTAFTADRSVDYALCRRGKCTAEERVRWGVLEDDILVTRVFATAEGVGLPTLVPALPEPAVFESNMMRLRVDRSVILPRLLFEWLRTPVARRIIESGVNASNQASVNQRVLNSLPVPLPSRDEQFRMLAVIEHIDRRIGAEKASLVQLRVIKLGLMQDLLTGKVRVKVDATSPEPAHA